MRRKKAGNYRPVSLTSILCKCMEHCVKKVFEVQSLIAFYNKIMLYKYRSVIITALGREIPLSPLGPTFPLFVIFKNKNIDGKIDLFVTHEAIVGTWYFIFHMISHFPSRALTVNKSDTSGGRPVKITC